MRRRSRTSCARGSARPARGSVLVIALVMLTLLTFLTITAFRMGKGNLQIVGNAQQKALSFAAAQGAIEKTISSPQFSATPGAALVNPCNGVANTSCVDVNGDGTPDITVTVAPTCMSSQVIPNALLDFTSGEDKGCTLGVNQDFGTDGAASGNSLCANVLWDIAANARDDVTGSQYTANQGVAVRVSSSQVCP
ncbi:MAG: hypothetical protein H7234_03365 [Herminiimonas sp.]|nr:hypothetical protein [Herminiimonas sp.]